MKDLIEVTTHLIDSQEQNSVDARELWRKLGVRRHFADWIQNRLAGFQSGTDYICVHKNVIRDDGCGGYRLTEYILTLDTAKHIAMLERNKIGYMIRQYFIDFEKHNMDKHRPHVRKKKIVGNTPSICLRDVKQELSISDFRKHMKEFMHKADMGFEIEIHSTRGRKFLVTSEQKPQDQPVFDLFLD